jgi:hypothetical protein
MMTDGEREQIKLQANALDRASTACLAVGLLTPIGNLLYSENVASAGWRLFLSTVIYLGLALILHRIAFWTLKGLDK